MDRRLPDEVALVYRMVGETHVFTSTGIDGLVHVGSHDKRTAFDCAFKALSLHVSKTSGMAVEYEPEQSFEEFFDDAHAAEITGNFIVAKRAKGEVAKLAC
jgi:hypothetical protein